MRMCIACRTGRPKRELIRIVRGPGGKFSVDASGKSQGRGAYLCADAACLEKAKKIFPKVMRCAMDEALYQALAEAVEKCEE